MRIGAQSRVINGFHKIFDQTSGSKDAALAPMAEVLKFMEICLHLGAHRTGSTSLQVFMNANRKLLSRDRLAVWGPGRTRSGLFAGMMRDPNRLTLSDLEQGQRTLGRVSMEVARAEHNGIHRLVISEENMIGTMAQNVNRCTLYKQALGRLERFAPAFGGHTIRVGLAVRSYESYWASALAFRIKGGAPFPGNDRLERLTTQPRRWRHLIYDIARVFPEAEIVVWPFEAWSGQPAMQLSALTGRLMPRGMVEPSKAHNASITAAQMHEIAVERDEDAIAASLQGAQGRYQPFDAEQIHKLRQDYATDIDWLIQGSDGLATYYDSTGATSGEPQDARGRYDDEENRLVRTG